MAISNKRILKQELMRITIIQTAKDLFLNKGYRAITMDEIAICSGITKRTLYMYYPSKLALFIHIFDEYFQLLHQHIIKAVHQALPSENVVLSTFNTLFEFTKEHEKFLRLYWTLDSNEFEGVIPDELISRIKIWTGAIMNETKALIIKAQTEGIIAKEINPELVIHLMSAVNKGIFIHTNKESKFEIANINPNDLFGLFMGVISRGLFEKT